MKLKNLVLAGVLIISSSATAQSTVVVDQQEDAPIISKHIYGHFAEHLGRCIYGGFYVGEDSEIPNTAGIRTDIIEALKAMKIPNLRWPGGCFADTYHWKDGIGPKEDRPTIVNQWWGGVTEDNSFGTHDFLNLCEVLGAEPYLAANIGSGTVQEFTDWIQYVNHDGESPMANLRRENGRDKPWGVKYWGVGNEMWGCGGNMTPEYYANLYRQYATFMSSWDNDKGIYRIASGANVDDYHWTEVLMRDVPKQLIEGVALHSYSFVEWDSKGPAVDFDENQYFKTIARALNMETLITEHTAIMDKYDPEGKIDLIVDEWGGWYNVEEGTNPGFLYQQNTMRDAMIAGATLNIFNNHSDRVKMANLAQTVNVLQAVILTDDEKMILTPTYHVMKMYAVHQDATRLDLDVNTESYEYNGEKLPAISVSASKNDQGQVHISVVNVDMNKSHELEMDLTKLNLKSAQASILGSKDVHDHNSFENPDKINVEEFKDFKFKKGNLAVELPPFSVLVFELK